MMKMIIQIVRVFLYFPLIATTLSMVPLSVFSYDGPGTIHTLYIDDSVVVYSG